ncbi:MAG: nucleoside deaminase [Bacteroidetes bacterium]|nr:nucleoside deaminase [Bacteroidota bacterium]
MLEALHLAEKALNSGNPPVGSVLVLNGKIIGKGIESGKTTQDVTNHAEILALRDAIKKGFVKNLHETVMYTTHEPCIMCSFAIRHYGVTKVVIGLNVQDVGGMTSKFNILNTTKVKKWTKKPQITFGLLKEYCQALTDKYIALKGKSIKGC